MDAVGQLAALSGLPREEIMRTWEDAKANHDALEACSGHHKFYTLKKPSGPEVAVCQKCSGVMSRMQAAMYVKGFRAAGGDIFEVWPEYAEAYAKRKATDGVVATAAR